MRRLSDHPETLTPSPTRFLAVLLAVAVLATAGGLPARAQDQAEEFAYDDVDLRVALWLDREAGEVYTKGETMEVGFQANRDAYAVVYRIDAEGLVTVLWPRTPLDDGFVFGGHEYRLPVTGGPALQAGVVEGEGHVEALVSRFPFDLRRLELDFHHQPREQRYAFRVAGDPFLAMNEINYTITGLEDPDEYVVTNFVSYYVHRQVDHPRYLCGQCHVDDATAYDPYRDQCTLDITVDYTWSNRWWDRYGYYPVYVNPVYVYVDPWTWRPWVNFWYDPWWRAPSVWVCDWYRPVHCWWDSPYYHGNSYTWYDRGYGHHRPLAPVLADRSRTKLREYGRVTTMLDGDARTKARRDAPTGREDAYRGERAKRRVQPRVDRDRDRRGNPGLQIHRGGGTRDRVGGAARPVVRHTAGGAAKAPRTGKVDPVTRPLGRERGSRDALTRPGSAGRVRDRDAGGRTIRPVEPRQRGSRIWNSDRATKGGTRQRRETVRPTNPRVRGGTTPTRRESGSVRDDRTGPSRRSSGGNQKVRDTRGGGSSRKQDSSVSGSRSSGGRSKSGGATRSRSGGGSSKGSRSGSGGKSRSSRG